MLLGSLLDIVSVQLTSLALSLVAIPTLNR